MFLRNIRTTGYARRRGGTGRRRYRRRGRHHRIRDRSEPEPMGTDAGLAEPADRPYTGAAVSGDRADDPGGRHEFRSTPGAHIDITAQLQTAIDNCLTDTLYLPSNRGRYYVTGNTTIVIRGNVRHLIGHGSELIHRLIADQSAVPHRHRRLRPPVIIEGTHSPRPRIGFTMDGRTYHNQHTPRCRVPGCKHWDHEHIARNWPHLHEQRPRSGISTSTSRRTCGRGCSTPTVDRRHQLDRREPLGPVLQVGVRSSGGART